MRGLFISGSNTGIGKTFIACELIKILKQKYSIKVRKPVESGCISKDGVIVAQDAILLGQACGNNESIEDICSFKFEDESSAEKASISSGVKLTLNNLVEACVTDNPNDFIIVEGAGGLYSPIGIQLLNSDLAVALKLDVVLVVKDELGAINQALLSVRAAQQQNLNVVMIVLNQITLNKLENFIELSRYTKIPVVVFAINMRHEFASKVLSFI